MARHRARSFLALLLAGVLAAVLGAACSTSVPAPLRSQSQSLAGDQTLRVLLPEAPRSLDPALAQDEREEAVVSQFSEPLLRLQSNLHDVQPGAAESFSVAPDGVTWTFRIRPGARWSDGQPVRAQEFVNQWRRLIDPRTGAPHADLFASVVRGGEAAAALDAHDSARVDAALAALGLSAPDEQTFVVVTPDGSPRLQWIATLPEGGPWRADLQVHPGTVGNGPFHVTEAGRDRTSLAPNPNYWAGRTTLSKLVLEYGADTATATSRYRAQEIDIAGNLTGPIDRSVRSDVVRMPELTVFWMDFNVERPPFIDARVRTAFAEAVDRDAIASEGLGGGAIPATTLIPNGMGGFHPEYGKPQEGNPAAARQLLDSAQVPHDQLEAIPMIVRDRPFDRAVAGLVAAQVQRNLGVTINVQPLSVADYTKRLRAGDFELAGPTGWTADYPEPGDFFAIFESDNGNNGSRYRSPRYDALVRLAGTELNGDRRDQLYGQAAQLLEQDSPVIFLVQRQRVSLVRPYVKGARRLPVDPWPGASSSGSIWIASH